MSRQPSGARRALVAAAVALAALAAVLPATSAMAADSDILVSNDGVNFAADLPTGLFDGSGLLVPLDSVTRSLWVQNTSSSNGSLRLSVDDFNSATNALTKSLTFTAESGGETVTSTADQLTECSAVVPTLPVGAGDTVRIDITIAVGNLTGTHGQDQAVPLNFTADVRDAASPFPADPCEGPDAGGGGGDNGNGGGNNGNNGNNNGNNNADGNLSGTGANAIPTVAWSVGLLGAGLLLVLAARRRRTEELQP